MLSALMPLFQKGLVTKPTCRCRAAKPGGSLEVFRRPWLSDPESEISITLEALPDGTANAKALAHEIQVLKQLKATL